MRWKYAIAVFLALAFVFASTVSASGPLLDGKWIKLNVKGFGYNIDAADMTKRSKGVFLGSCYMLVKYDYVNTHYTGRIACEASPNVWQETGSISFSITLPDEAVGGGYAGGAVRPDGYVTIRNKQGHFIGGYGTHFLLPVIRKGVLKNVLMSSWGEVISGSMNPSSVFYGGYQIKGRGVPTVPSVVIAALPAT
jgi:hypothetical protein